MKATGIVRRIDDLGRVVIPKEIRRTMRIREGDPLEIFTNNDGEVIFKKYSPMGEMLSFAQDLVTSISSGTHLTVSICDTDHFIAADGKNKKEIIEKQISSQLENICQDRKSFINNDNQDIFAFEGDSNKILVAAPVIAAGDIIGCVVLIENEEQQNILDTDINIAKIAANFLSLRNE